MNRFVVLVVGMLASSSFAQEFVPIFDGETLDNWSCPDMSFWSVEDGAITAESTPERPCKKNQFLVWQLGEIDDFELKLKYKITGSPRANSGVQIRSQLDETGHAVGYQCDIDKAGNWSGALYDEHGRKVLAKRGQKTVITAKGEKQSEQVGNAKELFAKIKPDDWNEYHIIAKGNRIVLRINGEQMSEVIDHEAANREYTGVLALQIHSGPPMKVQFKDIELKRLRLDDGRKKVVMIAGAPSHRSGDHEHNAGIKLLAKRLDAMPEKILAASYHDNGWPKDPTALDNADAVVIYSDGKGHHPAKGHLEVLEKHCSAGGGLMCIHFAVEVEKGVMGEAWKTWLGGHYEHGWSINPHWTLKDATLKEGHPVTRGVGEITHKDEWYYNMRWRDNAGSVIHLLQGRPSDEDRSGSTSWPRGPKPHIVEKSGQMETVMWAVDRDDGGRGVGFTGGHFHRNWANDHQRNLVLNAVLWVSGAEVPTEGIQSAAVDEDEINENLDQKGEMPQIKLGAFRARGGMESMQHVCEFCAGANQK